MWLKTNGIYFILSVDWQKQIILLKFIIETERLKKLK